MLIEVKLRIAISQTRTVDAKQIITLFLERFFSLISSGLGSEISMSTFIQNKSAICFKTYMSGIDSPRSHFDIALSE